MCVIYGEIRHTYSLYCREKKSIYTRDDLSSGPACQI